MNKDTVATNDDLVIAWYHTNTVTGIAWPDEPVRYRAAWPTNVETLVIASGVGSGPLSSVTYPSPRLYNQPDPDLPGFNPNEEHAALYGDTLYALRNDLNDILGYSEPYVLLKYRNPTTSEWQMKVYRVVAENDLYKFIYPGEAGQEIQLLPPLSFLTLCGNSNYVVSGPGFKDYLGRLYARAAGPENGGTNVITRYFYPLLPEFYYDLDHDGEPDRALDSPVPWLDRRAGTIGIPLSITNQITWPADVHALQIGETLFNAKYGLPGIRSFADAAVIFDEGNPYDTNAVNSLVRLFDPLSERTIQLRPTGSTNYLTRNGYKVYFVDKNYNLLTELSAAGVSTAILEGRTVFPDLPYAIRSRLFYDPLNKNLAFGGLLDESEEYGGENNPLLLINVLSPRERDRIKQLDGDQPEGVQTTFDRILDALYDLCRNPNHLDLDHNGVVDTNLLVGLVQEIATNGIPPVVTTNIVHEKFGDLHKALTAGPGTGSGYVTIAENNDARLNGLPVTLHVLRVTNQIYLGDLKVLKPDNVFDEKLTIRHSADFAGEPQRFEFEWYYKPFNDYAEGTNLPLVVASGEINQLNGWIPFMGIPSGINGYNDITIGEKGGPALSSLLTLADNWFICRYRGYTIDGQTPWSGWVGAIGGGQAQLAEGWIKRVIYGLNPFEARTDAFHESEAVTFASMLQQAGPRYEGDIAFNPSAANLNNIGLIEAYETVLHRGKSLSIDGMPAVNYGPANNALLLAAGRIADFYVLLGNEAYADAADPTIGFRTDAAGYGTLAPCIFTFQNQLDSLLEEELTLLRGRDDHSATVRRPSVYNRLFWNFTKDDGEVAYAQTYNITDQNADGFIDVNDASIMYPQGHGDAWGHYLTALTKYYDLLRNTNFTWVARSEAMLLAGVPVEVDYLDERKFARAASAKAKTGAELVDLTYRYNYVDDPAGQWQGYKDTDTDRAWGLSEWGHRAGSGAYFDWVMANAILPSVDPDTNHSGITKIDRTTVSEIQEIAAEYEAVQSQIDKADRGLNPLGLVKGVVPFDIDPTQISTNKTHFEQIYDRAIETMKNAVMVFNHANQMSQSLRSLQDSVNAFSSNTLQQEQDYKNRLIEVFGYPYAGDIGPGGTYPSGYDGPDIYHYMYVNTLELNGDTAPPNQTFTGYYARLFTLDRDPDWGAINYDPFYFPADLPQTSSNRLTNEILQVNFPFSAADFGFTAPTGWGQRRAPGEIQMALSELVQQQARLKQARLNYDNLLQQIDDIITLLQIKYNVEAEKVRIRDENHITSAALSAGVLTARRIQKVLADKIDKVEQISYVSLEMVPKIQGMAFDVTAPIRGSIRNLGLAAKTGLKVGEIIADTAAEAGVLAKDAVERATNFRLDKADVPYEIAQIFNQLEDLFRQEAGLRIEAFNQAEEVEQSSGKYQAALAKGLRLLEERVAFRKSAAASTQASRYQDMTFRIFRNDAIQKYRAQFDLAAQYVFLAAVAYDFETQLLGGSSGAGREFLTDIVRQRSLGEMENGVPIAGRHGLADPLARLSQNFNVLKGQLGFNNPQTETGRFSLRAELFRLKDSSDAEWRAVLKNHVVADLWDLPEFRRYCRPFAPESAGPQPGLVIRFPTTITFGLNFFNWPLSGGDSAYDPTLFATKVRSVGVWFKDYNGTGLSMTPRVYLIPAGADILRSPSGQNLETREWRVVDQKIPVPFPIGFSSLNDPAWIPLNDSLGETYADIRRFSSFRAYHDSGSFNAAETISDSRLIGRSVWNNDWVLIIPGGTFLNDANAGLLKFIDTVSDIKLFFQTYSYSGN
ncbi:MAG: hypothetical protein M1608_18145 [Candidatus Omnitrophica bacterium]|nr:hypothetical protein [Candidatus Omnitrophota bacterium]